MEIETEEILIEKCRLHIEEKVGWGNSEKWTTQDYELLSKQIAEATTVNLSIATLKRIWGKIRYDSKPTVTTLNTLAQYLGYENWRAFRSAQTTLNGNGRKNGVNGHHHTDSPEKKLSVQRKKYFWIGTVATVLMIAAALLFTWIETKDEPIKLNPDHFSFSSKKVVDEGLPNTVIFDYDATAASANDSIYIQQSWDKTLSTQVSRDEKQHTSIYYLPGFFQAKLRINNEVVKEHNLYIKTKGWLPLIDLKPVPVYFKEEEIIQNGFMQLPLDKIKENEISLQPETPWTCYYNLRDFGDVATNDFIFETSLKNDYSAGASACQHTEIQLLFEGATLVIPLSIPGCVSELTFLDRDGKKSDMSKFGVDFSDFVKVRTEVNDTVGRVTINGVVANQFLIKRPPARVVGMAFRFRGTGSVNGVKLSNNKGEVMFEEKFK
jgi:hypothetical protein